MPAGVRPRRLRVVVDAGRGVLPAAANADLPRFRKADRRIETRIVELRHTASAGSIDIGAEVSRLEAKSANCSAIRCAADAVAEIAGREDPDDRTSTIRRRVGR